MSSFDLLLRNGSILFIYRLSYAWTLTEKGTFSKGLKTELRAYFNTFICEGGAWSPSRRMMEYLFGDERPRAAVVVCLLLWLLRTFWRWLLICFCEDGSLKLPCKLLKTSLPKSVFRAYLITAPSSSLLTYFGLRSWTPPNATNNTIPTDHHLKQIQQPNHLLLSII